MVWKLVVLTENEVVSVVSFSSKDQRTVCQNDQLPHHQSSIQKNILTATKEKKNILTATNERLTAIKEMQEGKEILT